MRQKFNFRRHIYCEVKIGVSRSFADKLRISNVYQNSARSRRLKNRSK
jgi:hypothetical protein